MDSELSALGLRSAVDSGMPVKEHSGMGFGIDCFLRENNQYVQAEVDWERDVSVVVLLLLCDVIPETEYEWILLIEVLFSY